MKIIGYIIRSFAIIYYRFSIFLDHGMENYGQLCNPPFLKSIFVGLQLWPFVSIAFMVAFMLQQQIRDTVAYKAWNISSLVLCRKRAFTDLQVRYRELLSVFYKDTLENAVSCIPGITNYIDCDHMQVNESWIRFVRRNKEWWDCGSMVDIA